MSGAGPVLATLLPRLRRRGWTRAVLPGLASGLLGAGVVALFTPAAGAVLGAGLVVAIAVLLGCAVRAPALSLGPTGLAAHLDRRFPELEESAVLLGADRNALSPAERLQLARIAPRWTAVEASPERWLPPIRVRSPLVLGTLGVALLVAAPVLRPALGSLMEAAIDSTPGSRPVSSGEAVNSSRPGLRGIEIRPPAYTGQTPFTAQEWDVTLPEGAEVAWSVDWEGPGGLSLVFSDGTGERALPLVPDGPGRFDASTTIRRTGLYRLERHAGGETFALPGVHTLTVVLDRPPRLRLLEPATTRVDIPRGGPATLAYHVRIDDDHGLGPVEIRASVAKGSGEGVKFRDAVFPFDEVVTDGDGAVHRRSWRLPDLGMEPGDEVYFFTVARDRRTPEPNEARSDTVVVRWLDDEPPATAAEGLAIDTLPEYFKSQRQIIIETEQLIADRDGLDPGIFASTSRALGQAQSELKDRYGQYLGDEANEGGSPFPADEPADGDEPGEQDHDHDHDHEEADAAPAAPATDGSAADLVARFAHDHGSADIGPITRRNPVGLMKRSVANMWQAELHLRLGAPETALPFEYEALEYLNLARQADRIYTRRLGFEPPPVTEENRLTGELDEVDSRDRRRTARPDPDPDALARDLLALLATTGPGLTLAEPERDLLRRAARHFTELAGERPALIRHAATLERMAVAGRLDNPGCDTCLATLRQATWTLLPPAEPGPEPGRRPHRDPVAADYLEALDAARNRGGSR